MITSPMHRCMSSYLGGVSYWFEIVDFLLVIARIFVIIVHFLVFIL